MHFMTGAFLYIYKAILTASGLIAIKINLQLTIKDIEPLLHIRMHMGNSGFTCFKVSYCYLSKRAT